MGTTCCPSQPHTQHQTEDLSNIFVKGEMYIWLLLCCLTVLRAFPTYLAYQDDSLQFDNEEVEDSLFNLESELENLNQLDKRAPYNFGVGKRAPYGFGVGKRAPYNFGVGKRSPHNFGVGKRSPYNFGVGKRDLWQDGWRKRMPYNFGVGR